MAKLTKPTVIAPVVSVQQVIQPAIEVRTLIKAATSSIEAATPLVSMIFTLFFCFSCVFITNLIFLLQAPHMQEGLGDIETS